MTAPASALTVSPTASLLRYTDSWLLDDPFLGGARELSINNEVLWDFLCRLIELRSVTPETAADVAAAIGIPEAVVGRCLDSFRRAGILVPVSSRLSAPCGGPALQDWRLANLTVPADYRDPSIVSSDLQQMEEFAAAEAPPAVYKQWPATLRRVRLPHPVHDAPDRPHYVLGSVLYYSHAVIKPASLGPLPRSLRVAPSHGAAHPFDLSVTLYSQRELGPVLFAYDPVDHALVRLPADPVSQVPIDHAQVAVHLAARRVQWRYRASTAYSTIFLDLGHLLGVMEAVAESLELALAQVDLPDQAPIAVDVEDLGPVLSLRQFHTAQEEKESRTVR
ncbi:hypothetical protein GCM10009601_09770 [Streptomyces thermospinosisporus]|uniref:SagB/ThcOx family dehydrogenase n=1 Tax=Streptomyces thermospinosisporus TaxID=161482 RepID=A0ABP4J9U0_9ACTN